MDLEPSSSSPEFLLFLPSPKPANSFLPNQPAATCPAITMPYSPSHRACAPTPPFARTSSLCSLRPITSPALSPPAAPALHARAIIAPRTPGLALPYPLPHLRLCCCTERALH
ncbi:hypothetical protein SLEP1_g39033 [Rubroshorea leprosula]|uniref:Uncharacterized protein n=1 Tax=Rubroshorea leprosula TaxID=152421 RepID=A0AAV5KZM3_9ROSI|nr:hypothetical protein SLEP1_g39033 [Rubroshorea leprosula]